jgi:hypothetical protein
MTIEMLRKFLAWCTVLNMGLLVFWWLLFMVARDWIYRYHGRWFKLTTETFDAIHYSGMAGFKILIFFFNLVPYLVLRFFF